MGNVFINGSLNKPAVPMVFQTPSSLEWYSVLDNIALPLLLKGIPKAQAREQAMQMVKTVGLEGHEKKYAKAPLLSGGQLQRVAIARGLIANPSMIVCDEISSGLDLPNKRKMQDFVYKLFTDSEIADLNPTIIMVSHDMAELTYLTNSVIVMSYGAIKAWHKVDLPSRDRKSAKFAETVNYLESLI